MEMGGLFKMTQKTRLYLWLYRRFDSISHISQYFITRCDMESDSKSILEKLEEV